MGADIHPKWGAQHHSTRSNTIKIVITYLQFGFNVRLGTLKLQQSINQYRDVVYVPILVVEHLVPPFTLNEVPKHGIKVLVRFQHINRLQFYG